MTEEPKPKLGLTGHNPLTHAFGGYAATVDLLPGEAVLNSYEVGYVKGLAGAWGIMYLTTHRLVWIRMRFASPWATKTLEIPLDAITAVETQRSWDRWLIPFAPGLVAIRRKDAEVCQFMASGVGPGAKKIVAEITNILRERGLLRD